MATYQSAETLDGSANDTSDTALSGYPGLDGNIYVHAGNRIPLIPKQNGKAYADFQATSKLVFDLSEVAVSSSYARGNENNAYKADGTYYLGPGVSPGYGVTNFLAHYDFTKHFQLAVQVDNLFNLHYYTAAQLANTGLSAQGTFMARPFPDYATGLKLEIIRCRVRRSSRPELRGGLGWNCESGSEHGRNGVRRAVRGPADEERVQGDRLTFRHLTFMLFV